jgi:hypothetical protein
MKKRLITLLSLFLVVLTIISCKKDDNSTPAPVVPGNAGLLIIDHNHTNLGAIPANWIDSAKAKLHIAYEHTSHGNQIIVGMNGLRDLTLTNLVGYQGDIYQWHDGPQAGALDLDNDFASGDLGHNGSLAWEASTRDYLANTANSDVNVIMWSWCGGVSDNTEEGINTYLNAMNQLEADFPDIIFVYMTGHLDGTGEDGNLHIRNEQIRKFCNDNQKVLYDFADIESYDPDGNYFLDKAANDACAYDTDDDGSRDGNWAVEWRNAHQENVDWYDTNPNPDHTDDLNGNLKAYAAWHLWARLAGWNGQ